MLTKRKPAKSTRSHPKSAKRPYADDATRWQAIVERDRDADGAFVYSVRTTGVYCRPSCGSRLARRENVRFFSTCHEAERAGFRPCKRCRPREATLAQRHAEAVARACRLIESAAEAPTLAALAASVGMSPFHFHRVFKMFTGVTPKAYAAARRAGRVRGKLAAGSSIAEAICDAGFQSHGRFYASSRAELGMTPSEFRAGGEGATIRFAVGECSLGSILVAASDKGICAILLGDDPDALARNLQDRFPKARVIAAEATFDRWVAEAVGLVEKPALGLNLPLDIRGTAFQLRVWAALRQIAPGATASYAAIAERIGSRHAVRAVAQACAANPLAVAIPCHRVVRTDESLSGYRWGVERKAELLRRERMAVSTDVGTATPIDSGCPI